MPEKTIKVRGEIETDKDYQIGQEISIKGEVTSIELQDDFSGDFKKIHKVKIMEEI